MINSTVLQCEIIYYQTGWLMSHTIGYCYACEVSLNVFRQRCIRGCCRGEKDGEGNNLKKFHHDAFVWLFWCFCFCVQFCFMRMIQQMARPSIYFVIVGLISAYDGTLLSRICLRATRRKLPRIFCQVRIHTRRAMTCESRITQCKKPAESSSRAM